MKLDQLNKTQSGPNIIFESVRTALNFVQLIEFQNSLTIPENGMNIDLDVVKYSKVDFTFQKKSWKRK